MTKGSRDLASNPESAAIGYSDAPRLRPARFRVLAPARARAAAYPGLAPAAVPPRPALERAERLEFAARGLRRVCPVAQPGAHRARPFSIAVGQLIGLVAGFVGVFAASATAVPQFMGDHTLVGVRVFAIIIATFIAALVQLLTSATTPAGAPPPSSSQSVRKRQMAPAPST